MSSYKYLSWLGEARVDRQEYIRYLVLQIVCRENTIFSVNILNP